MICQLWRSPQILTRDICPCLESGTWRFHGSTFATQQGGRKYHIHCRRPFWWKAMEPLELNPVLCSTIYLSVRPSYCPFSSLSIKSFIDAVNKKNTQPIHTQLTFAGLAWSALRRQHHDHLVIGPNKCCTWPNYGVLDLYQLISSRTYNKIPLNIVHQFIWHLPFLLGNSTTDICHLHKLCLSHTKT